MAANSEEQNDVLSESMNSLTISQDPRIKLKSWLCKTLKIVITDKRVIVGLFVCTDRDGNVILENSWEYTNDIGKYLQNAQDQQFLYNVTDSNLTR